MTYHNLDARFRYLLYSRAFRSAAIVYMSLAFSLYLSALHVTLTYIGIISGLTMLFVVCLTILLGIIGDRYGYRKELIIAEVVSFSGALMVGLSYTPLYIVMGMVIGGVGGGAGGLRGAFSPGTNAFIANNYPDQNKRINKYSLVTLVGSISAIGGSILFAMVVPLSNLVGLLNSYRYLFLLSACLLILSILSLARLTEEKKPKKTTKVMKSSSMHYSAKVIATNLIGGIGVGLFLPLLPLWFALSYGANALEIGIIFTSVYLATALGSYLSSRIAHRLDTLNVAAYARTLNGMLLFAMAFSPALIFAAAFYLLRAVLAGFGSPSRTAINMKGIDPEDYGTATGIQGVASRVGQLSSGLSGYLMDNSLPLPIFIGGMLQIASGVGYKMLFRKNRRIRP
ncbi:MAG: MFS transporter [Candidatus Marsarchaeota archaeon]|nr:MFS transporter [Candidatus Marsarchaeota archaeon]MCL5413387.1 MFS transporter [Candidatus Marsarchaeota archaeon]